MSSVRLQVLGNNKRKTIQVRKSEMTGPVWRSKDREGMDK